MEPINNTPQGNFPLENSVSPDIQTNQSTQTPPTNTTKRNSLGKIISIIIILILLATSGVAGYFIYKNTVATPERVACTMEAMICPDGTSVGRTGPKCEFSPCPTAIPDPMANWQIFTGEDFSFKYPNGLFESNIGSDSVNVYINGDVNNSFGFVKNFRIKELFSNEVGSLEEYLQLYSYNLNYQRSEVDIHNSKFYKFISNPNIETKSVRYLTSKGDFIYEFYLNYNNPEYVALLDNILSTFQFTN